MSAPSPALSPEVIAAIDDLDLAARLVVESVRSGGHRSPLHGYSAEFQQHRPYRAGDDLKYLDWKLLARTDRLYSKQFRETTSMSVMLVLDTSASMAYPAEGVSKFRYGVIAAASLAYLIAAQGDAVGLMTSAGSALSYLPARGGRPHLRLLTAQLDRLAPDGAWDPPRVIARGAELLKRRGMVIVISDFYDAEEDTRRELARVARRGHDVSMLHVLSPGELQLPSAGVIELEDLETSAHRLVDARAAGAGYHEAMTGFLDRCERGAHRSGVDYALLRTDAPPGRALRNYLLRRGARRQPAHAARMDFA